MQFRLRSKRNISKLQLQLLHQFFSPSLKNFKNVFLCGVCGCLTFKCCQLRFFISLIKTFSKLFCAHARALIIVWKFSIFMLNLHSKIYFFTFLTFNSQNYFQKNFFSFLFLLFYLSLKTRDTSVLYRTQSQLYWFLFV